MPPKEFEKTGHGTIRDTFRIAGRGVCLTIENSFQGHLYRGGTIESDRGAAPINGIEYATGAGQSWVVVVVDFAFGDLFAAGDTVHFYRGQ
jgi:hypothetical protein